MNGHNEDNYSLVDWTMSGLVIRTAETKAQSCII